MTAPAPADNAPHILVIDDDERIATLLARFLQGNGLRVSCARDAGEARAHLKSLAFDLLIVDVMMPGEDGLSLTRALKREKDVPVLLLTAKAEGEDRIRGLEAGADDYLTKPFEPRELLLRLNNILKYRRSEMPWRESVRFGRFVFDLKREELRAGGDVVPLTGRERQLLGLLAMAHEGTLARAVLAGSDEEANLRTVDVHINRLRRKIEDDPAHPLYLQTVRGIGYRLRCE